METRQKCKKTEDAKNAQMQRFERMQKIPRV